MNCDIAGKYIMKHFDGDINDIEAAQLKQHLKMCAKCSHEFSQMSEIFGVLKEDGMIEPPMDFELKVMEKVSLLNSDKAKETYKTLAFFYTGISIIIAALAIMLASSLQGINLPNLLEITERLGALSSVATACVNILTSFFVLLKGTFGGLLQVTFLIFKTYNYVFITLIIMLFMVQQTYTNYVKQTDGGAK